MTTTTITRPLLAALRDDINAALADVAKKHGIALTLGRCTFDASSAKFGLEVTTVAEGADASDPFLSHKVKAASIWKAHAGLLQTLYGVDADLLHKAIAFGGKQYRVEGMQARGERFPFLASTPDGRLVKLTADHLKAGKVVG